MTKKKAWPSALDLRTIDQAIAKPPKKKEKKEREAKAAKEFTPQVEAVKEKKWHKYLERNIVIREQAAIARQTRLPKSVKGIPIKGIAKTRTQYWIARVLETAQCSIAELEKNYLFRISSPEFLLYAAGRRTPTKAILKAVEAAEPLAGAPSLKNTARFFDGPEGARLWDVLQGDVSACQDILDAYYSDEFGALELVNSSFSKKLALIESSLMHPDQIAELHHAFSARGSGYSFREHFLKDTLIRAYEEKFGRLDPEDPNLEANGQAVYASLEVSPELERRIEGYASFSHQLSRFTHSVVMDAGLRRNDLYHPIYDNFKSGQKYPFDLLVATLALRVVAYGNRSDRKLVDYMALGVFHIMFDLLPEIRDELFTYFDNDIMKQLQSI